MKARCAWTHRACEAEVPFAVSINETHSTPRVGDSAIQSSRREKKQDNVDISMSGPGYFETCRHVKRPRRPLRNFFTGPPRSPEDFSDGNQVVSLTLHGLFSQCASDKDRDTTTASNKNNLNYLFFDGPFRFFLRGMGFLVGFDGVSSALPIILSKSSAFIRYFSSDFPTFGFVLHGHSVNVFPGCQCQEQSLRLNYPEPHTGFYNPLNAADRSLHHILS